jgi:predicted transglutaminase-like cysteine proteinase
MLPAACHQDFSHQPYTINQMKLLVTPQEQTVTQALQEALGTTIQTSTDDPSPAVDDINQIRLWVYSHIKQASDEDLHGVTDYWQTPTETLNLKAGDCEDFAILMVSLMRAYGVPQNQVYVAVGIGVNKDWHAFVLEKYCYGSWTEFDPEYLDNAMLLVSNMPQPYDISYCFNDNSGFNGAPVYPPGYTAPPVSIVPVVPPPAIISPGYSDLTFNLDEAKQHLGELWLPAYVPQGYILAYRFAYSMSDKWHLTLMYHSGNGSQLYISEIIATPGLREVGGNFEQITLNNQPAYLGLVAFASGTGSSMSVQSMLLLDFIQGGLEINIGGAAADSSMREELIKIAESLEEY